MRPLIVFVACCAILARPQTVYEKTAKFSKFRALLDLDVTSLHSLYQREATVFAPVDRAFDKFDRKPSRNLASYHVVEGAHDFPKFNSNAESLRSVGEANPPLWITERNLHVYINNALVLGEEFGYSSANQLNKSQRLYALDEVLDPMVRDCPNPSALDFLKRTPQWNTSYTAASFLADVIQNRLEDFFDGEQGKYTFFIPIDGNNTRRLNIYALKAHVVPGRALFTRPSEKAYWFPTLASDDYFKVFISVSVSAAAAEKQNRHLVVAETVDEANTTTMAKAEIVFGNIPLQNGVAHLISQPLAIYPRPKNTLPGCELIDKFSGFANLNTTYFLGVHTDFNENFNLPAKFTFFAPSNAAWDSLGDKLALFDVKRPERVRTIRRILERHLVVGEIPVTLETLEKVTAESSCANLKTASDRVCLSARKSGAEYEVTWKGITAPVSRVNYECADGLMHIIDAPLVDDDDFDELEHKMSVDFVKIWKKLKEFL